MNRLPGLAKVQSLAMSQAFKEKWLQRPGPTVNDGLAADVVTMNTTTDVQFLADNGVVAKD